MQVMLQYTAEKGIKPVHVVGPLDVPVAWDSTRALSVWMHMVSNDVSLYSYDGVSLYLKASYIITNTMTGKVKLLSYLSPMWGLRWEWSNFGVPLLQSKKSCAIGALVAHILCSIPKPTHTQESTDQGWSSQHPSSWSVAKELSCLLTL